MTENQGRFAAFISYSHVDKSFARRLHEWLECFSIPEKAGFGRFFLDQVELGAAASLSDAIKAALSDSEALIVVVSEHALESKWVAEEVAHFRACHLSRPIFLIIPAHCKLTGVQAVRSYQSLLGKVADEPEPLAADCRERGEEGAFVQLAAGLLGMNLGDLTDRHEAQKRTSFERACKALARAYSDPVKHAYDRGRSDQVLKLLAAYCLDSSDYSLRYATPLIPWLRSAFANSQIGFALPPDRQHDHPRTTTISPDCEWAAVDLGRAASVINVGSGKVEVLPYSTFDLIAFLDPDSDYERRDRLTRASLVWASHSRLIVCDRISLRLYDTKSKQSVFLGYADQGKPFVAVSASTCGRYVASATAWGDIADTGLPYKFNVFGRGLSISIWDTRELKERARFPFQSRADEQFKLAVCSSGTVVAVERENGSVTLFTKDMPPRELGGNRPPSFYTDRQGRISILPSTATPPSSSHRLDTTSGVRLYEIGGEINAFGIEDGVPLWSKRLSGMLSLTQDGRTICERLDDHWLLRDAISGNAIATLPGAVVSDSIQFCSQKKLALGVGNHARDGLKIWKSLSSSEVARWYGGDAWNEARKRIEETAFDKSPAQLGALYDRFAFAIRDGDEVTPETILDDFDEDCSLIAYRGDTKSKIMDASSLLPLLSTEAFVLTGYLAPNGKLLLIVEDETKVLVIDLAAAACAGWIGRCEMILLDSSIEWERDSRLVAIGNNAGGVVFNLEVFALAGAELCHKLAEQSERLGPVTPGDSDIAMLKSYLGTNVFEQLDRALKRDALQPEHSAGQERPTAH